jgi:hypothetical protein
LIADGKVGLIQYDDIDAVDAEGVCLKDGHRIAGSLVVLATGYKGMDHAVGAMFGDQVAQRVGRMWGLTRKRS